MAKKHVHIDTHNKNMLTIGLVAILAIFVLTVVFVSRDSADVVVEIEGEEFVVSDGGVYDEGGNLVGEGGRVRKSRDRKRSGKINNVNNIVLEGSDGVTIEIDFDKRVVVRKWKGSRIKEDSNAIVPEVVAIDCYTETTTYDSSGQIISQVTQVNENCDESVDSTIYLD
jgi:hypothetical protein